MGSIGDPWDNAVAESFFAGLEKELLRRERFATREQARRIVAIPAAQTRLQDLSRISSLRIGCT